MKARITLALAFLLAIGLMSGCGRSGDLSAPAGGSGSSTAMDEAEISSAMAAAPEAVEDGQFESSEEMALDAEADGALAAIRPFRWWRVIRDVDRSFEFAFSDTDSTGRPTKAIVTVHKRLQGSFNVLAGAPETDPQTPRDSLDLIRKPLDDRWVRRVLLHRVRMNERRALWRIAASSGVRVTSKDATSHIVSLRVQTADFDSTITDPLAFFFLRRLIKVNPMEQVTLTVTTDRNDDVLALYSRAGRFRFHNNGDNTYTGTWRSPMFAGIQHVGVNALSNGTLFDDQAPYDSQAWILPYVVVPNLVAEYLPDDDR